MLFVQTESWLIWGSICSTSLILKIFEPFPLCPYLPCYIKCKHIICRQWIKGHWPCQPRSSESWEGFCAKQILCVWSVTGKKNLYNFEGKRDHQLQKKNKTPEQFLKLAMHYHFYLFLAATHTTHSNTACVCNRQSGSWHAACGAPDQQFYFLAQTVSATLRWLRH